MLLVFVLARKRRLDLVTVRAVAERRPPERSGVDERCAATNFVNLFFSMPRGFVEYSSIYKLEGCGLDVTRFANIANPQC
jgi:hypothetical protein